MKKPLKVATTKVGREVKFALWNENNEHVCDMEPLELFEFGLSIIEPARHALFELKEIKQQAPGQ